MSLTDLETRWLDLLRGITEEQRTQTSHHARRLAALECRADEADHRLGMLELDKPGLDKPEPTRTHGPAPGEAVRVPLSALERTELRDAHRVILTLALAVLLSGILLIALVIAYHNHT